MWTGYAPAMLYEKKVTVVELICASPCITTLLCFSMESRHRGDNLFDEEAHMARHRVGARGNALTFPLPWEDLTKFLDEAADDEAAMSKKLPRTGDELAEVVRVLLKTNKQGETTEAEIKTLIHQAIVRRQVVVDLILHMKMCGHPIYQPLDESVVRSRAETLPCNGVPPEILKVVNEIDNAHDKLQPQKAAAPTESMVSTEDAQTILSGQRARAIVPEGQSAEQQDANAVSVAAIEKMAQALSPGYRHKSTIPSVEVRTGNVMVDQFQPFYFAVAFSFCFKYCTGCPDVANTVNKDSIRGDRRHQGDPNAPHVNIYAWLSAMARRVETQFRRDWTFGFVSWNYIFRTMVNLQKNTFMYSTHDPHTGNKRSFTFTEITNAHIEILRALAKGRYTDIQGEQKPVNGDLSKLQHVKDLSPAAKRLLLNVQAKSRNIPGTHEVRKTMRHQTHANRVCYGTALFVTFSPSERDSTLMLRLARARQSDPAVVHDHSSNFQGRSKPDLDVEFCHLSGEDLAKALPNYDLRRAILSRDPLACCEGFHTLVLLTLRHLFGVRFCQKCSGCATSACPCTDAFGSNATATGGVLGRVDAVYGSIECQKAGSLHAHFQVFLQCKHQFTPLSDIAKLCKEEMKRLITRYSAYTQHVRRMTYVDPTMWEEQDRHTVENAWPEFRDETLTLSRPSYQHDCDMEPVAWKRRYIEEDVEALQKRKQHHVHIPIEPGGPRMPLAHCRDPQDPTRCKAGLPHDLQLTDQTVIICRGLAERMQMPITGKRSMLGSIWGPVNDPNLNGTHPALLAALRCNSDVQIPFRFPVTSLTHSDQECPDDCPKGCRIRDIIKEAQTTQAAQAGYACDYQNKRCQKSWAIISPMRKTDTQIYKQPQAQA